METNETDSKKSHRKRHSGRKAEKKKQKDKNVEIQTDKLKNPKAFAFNSAVRAERRFRRKQDLETKKQHIPVIDRTPIEPPPILIAVVGPPKTGKSTIINNLIKFFTKSTITNINGPVTIVTGKKRRITIIECNNDINCMIDIAKIADLVLLLCDANFGFEMEVFEFLNICQVHGMPRIIGVLTHLDLVKNSKALKHTKKTLKHRFWTEVYPGAKLFYLSGIVHGEYLKNEIKNLGRFISVMKFRPITWRSTHSYLLVDRYEDLTNPELIRQNRKCERNISLYGYVRGVPLSKNSGIHIPGIGDYKISDVSFLSDPCPLPETIKKRSLTEKERFIYAPFSGLGGIVYDKDAVYVELKGSHSHSENISDDSKNLVNNLIDTRKTLDYKIQESEMQIFTDGEKIKSKSVESDIKNNGIVEIIDSTILKDNDEMKEKHKNEKQPDLNDDLCYELKEIRDNELTNLKEEILVDSNGRTRRKVIFSDKDETDDDSDEDNKVEVENYVKLSQNKDEHIRNKINDVLETLEKNQKINKNDSEESSDESDDDISDEENEAEYDSNDEISSELSDASEAESKEKNIIELNETLQSKEEPNSKNDKDMKDSEEIDQSLKWKNNLSANALDAFLERQQNSKNIMKLVYGIFNKNMFNKNIENDNNEEEDDLGGLFKIVSHEQKRKQIEKDEVNQIEISLTSTWNLASKNWLEPDNKILIENCFMTGKWKDSEDANKLLELDDLDIDGDFEDLETGEKHTAIKNKRKHDDSNDESDNDEPTGVSLAEKKRKLKEKFDKEYDNETDKQTFYDDLKTSVEKQSKLNTSVFEEMSDEMRVQLEGFRPGMYVRVELQEIPFEFIEHFDPTYPVLIGGLNIGEENIGFVNVKIKKHRWYKRILKSQNPVILSMGWRRFQTTMLFSKLEDDLKFRYLKYTPEHVTCNGHFWGPITPQGTGFLAVQDCTNDSTILKQGFRIAATGCVQELEKSTQIMKKLKLIGEPLKIFKKTAFINGMFSSSLEVAKFEGVKIKTVSGVRGIIKKAVSRPEGCFRASFEDKILLSDIVFCRTWYRVDIPKFYNPITNLLLPPEEKNAWSGMKTLGELKRINGIKNNINTDTLYTEINRGPKVFKPLVIPRKLQQTLPYKDKPKHQPIKGTNKYEPVAVIREPHEQKVAMLMKRLKTTYSAKQEKLKHSMSERIEKHVAEINEAKEKLTKKQQQSKKEICKMKSKKSLSKKASENRKNRR